jgi:hypothetical protein
MTTSEDDMGIKITGLDAFREKLNTLQRRAQSASGPVQFDDLFPPEFMRRYTDFKSIQEMFDSSGVKIESQQDFDGMPADTWDGLVSKRTRFKSWDEMQAKAGEEYIAGRLNLDNL